MWLNTILAWFWCSSFWAAVCAHNSLLPVYISCTESGAPQAASRPALPSWELWSWGVGGRWQEGSGQSRWSSVGELLHPPDRLVSCAAPSHTHICVQTSQMFGHAATLRRKHSTPLYLCVVYLFTHVVCSVCLSFMCVFCVCVQAAPKPIAMEPCWGSRAGVLTVLLYLPRVPSGTPPPGQSGTTHTNNLKQIFFFC